MRRGCFYFIIAGTIYFTLDGVGSASPTAIDSKTFSNPTTSLVLGDDADPLRLWVLPPTSGKITDVKPQLSVTLPICRSLATASKGIEQIRTQQDTIREQQFNVLN